LSGLALSLSYPGLEGVGQRKGPLRPQSTFIVPRGLRAVGT